MLYRFYQHGIRYTVEAKTKKEATARFHQARKDHAKGFTHGNSRTPRSRQRKPNVSLSNFDVETLNAFDSGYTLGAAGFCSIPKIVQRTLHTQAQNSMARAGLAAGSRH